MTASDLAAYSATERPPVCGSYRGYRICGMGPPSSGGIAVLETLGMLERFDALIRAPHGILTCTATPIHDPYGQLVGVLDISGDARAQHLHALGLVRMAVANIEHRFFEGGLDGCELLRLQRDGLRSREAASSPP